MASNMLLITEYLPNTTEIRVEDTGAGKNMYIEGIFAQDTITNRNKRRYPKDVMAGAVERYMEEKVKTNRALGELNHPNSPTVDPERASHRIVDLHEDGNDWYGKALVLNTPMGNLVRGLIEGGTSIGVSTRGLGSVKPVDGSITEVQSDFSMAAVDVVYDPSAPSAFVNGIMEGVEFFMEDGMLTQRKIESIKQQVHATPGKDLPRAMDAIFRDVMESFMNQNS